MTILGIPTQARWFIWLEFDHWWFAKIYDELHV